MTDVTTTSYEGFQFQRAASLSERGEGGGGEGGGTGGSGVGGGRGLGQLLADGPLHTSPHLPPSSLQFPCPDMAQLVERPRHEEAQD